MSSPILDMENINMRLGPSNMGRCGNGRGVHFGGVTMHPLTVGHPMAPWAHTSEHTASCQSWNRKHIKLYQKLIMEKHKKIGNPTDPSLMNEMDPPVLIKAFNQLNKVIPHIVVAVNKTKPTPPVRRVTSWEEMVQNMSQIAHRHPKIFFGRVTQDLCSPLFQSA